MSAAPGAAHPVRARPAAARLRAGGPGIAAVEAFSRGAALDRDWMGWGALRVLSHQDWTPGAARDDGRVANMDRLLLVLQGTLDVDAGVLGRHRAGAGRALWMGCGHGLESRLANASTTAPLRLVECWLQPRRVNAAPAVGLVDLAADAGAGPGGGDGDGLRWNALPPAAGTTDASPTAGVRWSVAAAAGGGTIALPRAGDALRYWLEVLDGEGEVDGSGRLRPGDGLAWTSGAPGAPVAIRAVGATGVRVLLLALPA